MEGRITNCEHVLPRLPFIGASKLLEQYETSSGTHSLFFVTRMDGLRFFSTMIVKTVTQRCVIPCYRNGQQVDRYRPVEREAIFARLSKLQRFDRKLFYLANVIESMVVCTFHIIFHITCILCNLHCRIS